jgi:hypothetical protein
VQGTLGGVILAILGVPGAVLLGLMMIVLSLLPLIGGALVWVPVAIVLAIQGAWIKALVLAGFCSIVIGSIDNVLRPRLVGHDTKMSDLLILFSTLGGIAAFGAIGFIVGPIIAALFITIWEIFGKAYRDDLDVEPTPRSSCRPDERRVSMSRSVLLLRMVTPISGPHGRARTRFLGGALKDRQKSRTITLRSTRLVWTRVDGRDDKAMGC